MFKIIDDIIVNFIDYDDGKPIVLLHDWNQNLETMDSLGRSLTNYRKILLDFPGFGDSEEPSKAYNLDDYADALRKLLLELKIENPILVGNCFGGRVAIKYASKYVVEKLILLATPYKNDIQSFKEKMFYTSKNTFIGNLVKKCVGSKDYKELSDVMKETYVNVSSENILDDARQINVPTLLICGNEEGNVSLNIVEELTSHLNNADIIELQGSRDGYLQNGERMAGLLNKYLDGHKVKKRIK